MSNFQYELIIVISNQGYVDDIMETAKANGAKGGTVLHGRSATFKEAVKFFGITVHPEKELLLIVTKADVKAQIMKAIGDKHGIDTEARALCFSLPVTDLVGFNF